MLHSPTQVLLAFIANLPEKGLVSKNRCGGPVKSIGSGIFGQAASLGISGR